jgi:regulator of chromosome condensation
MANNNTKKAAPAKKPPKKAAAPKKHVAPGKVAASKPKKVGPVINEVPTKLLDIYVFGEGSAGELGLGAMKFQGKKPIDVKRPRLNHLLSAKDVGVVAIAVGGMHCAVLTHDNRILTWGVNDDGALGRQTDAAKMVDMQNDDDEDSDEDSDDEDSGLNPSEAEPRAVDPKHFPEGTKFAKLIACDSATFVATEDGLVYGWGSFRVSPLLLILVSITNIIKDELGPLGFREDKDIQLTPILIPELKGVIDLAAGTNHILALTNKGKVLAWGSSESNQLARRVVKRTAHGALIPREFGLKGVTTAIGCGDFHSFAVNKDGTVRAWGLNSYGECLISKDGPGDNDIVPAPTIVKKLKGFNITQIAGGAHHGIALTEEGKVLTWGRMDMEEGGILPSEYPEGALFVDEHGRPRMAVEPTEVPSKSINLNQNLLSDFLSRYQREVDCLWPRAPVCCQQGWTSILLGFLCELPDWPRYR